MAKTRIYDVAKELNVESAVILKYLKEGLKIEVKTSSSSIDDDVKSKVSAHFASANAKTAPAKASVGKSDATPKKDADAKTAAPASHDQKKADHAKATEHKKKSTITAVFNPRYAGEHGNNNRRRPGQGGQGQNGQKRPSQNSSYAGRDNRNNNANQVHHLIKPRTGSGPIRADGTREGEPTLAEQRALAQEEAKRRAAEEAKLTASKTKTELVETKPAVEPAATEQEKPKPIRRPNIYDNKPQGEHNSNNGNRSDRNNGPRNDRNNSHNGGNGNNGRNDRNDRNGRPNNNRNGRLMDNEPVPAENAKNSNNRKANNSHRKNDRKDRNYEKNQENFNNLEKNGGKKPHKPQPQKVEEEIKSIKVPDHLTLRELAERMKLNPSVLIKKLFMKGVMMTLNSDIDYEKAEEIALEFDILCEHEEVVDVIEEMLKEDEDDPKKLVPRPPVVCVMGHVDHGKTSLLDAIRDSKVTDREAGGITQKIGAYSVDVNGQKITFLDTPGHEAFTAMRMRGAKSTDIAVLVVAADDGVMPQTVEAINHAKAAGVEIIVAVNKIDKPNANIDRVKQELSEYDLIPEDWGGSTVFTPVSAKTHEGIDNLLDMILLTAEVMELKADPKREARGLVIEAQLDKGRGPVATVLVQKGTLHVGDAISAGSSFGKIRAMTDEHGNRVKAAGPSVPVEVQGLSDVPNAGEVFVAHKNEKDARAFAQEFVNVEKKKLVDESRSRMSLDNLFNQVQAGNIKELDIIVKADVQGSVEAVKQSLEKLSNDEVVVKCIHGGVGAITESDVVLASASNAIIIGFNVRPDAVAKDIAERENVDIHLYSVIYNAIEDVEHAMKGMLEPIYEEKVLGHGEVRMTFKSSGVGIIAGSIVNDGVFQRGAKIRLTREGKQLYDGALASLKRFKDDAKEVREGYECGVVLDNFTDIKEGDQLECYTMVEVPRT